MGSGAVFKRSFVSWQYPIGRGVGLHEAGSLF